MIDRTCNYTKRDNDENQNHPCFQNFCFLKGFSKKKMSKTSCAHIWGPYTKPIPLVATIPPVHYYTCNKCKCDWITTLEIPIVKNAANSCEHVYEPVLGPGPNYEARRCKLCNHQYCKRAF